MARSTSSTVPPRQKTGMLLNNAITASRVRLIDEGGNNLGVVPVGRAREMARESGLDLALIGQTEDPPVARMLNYNKHVYELQKRKQQARRRQKTVSVKEIKFRPTIDDHDYGVKLRAARRFLTDGDKVKVTLRMRGRELANRQYGMDLLLRVTDDLADVAKQEKSPESEGRQIVMILCRR